MTDLVSRATCSAIVITCSDFRFKSAEEAFERSLGLADDFDLIARPGAIRSLVEPRSDAARTTMVEEIELLWRLHAFTRVIAVNHQSCRAYDDIATPDNEVDVHTGHLRRAVREIETLFAGVRAEPFLVGRDLVVRAVPRA